MNGPPAVAIGNHEGTRPCFPWTLLDNGTYCAWLTGGNLVGNTSVGLSDTSVPHLWTLWLLVFPVLTVFGNVLVVLGVQRERSLQTATNYFIVSLAIADIMVAILVMPLAVYVEVMFVKCKK